MFFKFSYKVLSVIQSLINSRNVELPLLIIIIGIILISIISKITLNRHNNNISVYGDYTIICDNKGFKSTVKKLIRKIIK
jgi:hypothetical protein